MSVVMHGNRATYPIKSCTETVHVGSAQHARVGVQHTSPSPCTAAVQRTLHGFSATQDNRYRTTDPVMHYVQDGRNPYRTFRRLPLTYRTTNATPDRARGLVVA